MKQIITAITLAVAFGTLADSTSSWTWNCESTDYIASRNAGNLACDALTSVATANDMSTTIEVESGHLKLTPATTDAGGHFATVTLPAEVSSYSSSQYDNWTLSFDYAPSRGQNDQNQTIYGLSVHDQAGKALVWFYGYQKTSFTVFKGPDQTSSLGTIDVGDITQYNSSGATNWFHVVISASRTDGVTIAMTNLTSGAEVALSSNVLSEQFAAPQSVLVRTASYSTPARQQWALLDNFSFEGTTIYKTKYTKSVECTFENDADQSILTNGFVTSTLLGTTEKINDSVNWSAVTGEASPKSEEKFAQISSTQSNTQGLLVNLPKSVTRATEYVLEFDAMMMRGYNNQNTNGIAIVGRNGVLATLFNSGDTTQAILYKGDSAENVLKDGIAITSYKKSGSDNTPPSTNECDWYHFIVRGDAENGVRLSMSNVATGASVVENVSLGAYDTVEKIALRASIHSSRTIYACIDNIEAYTYRKKGLIITFR